jgi:hypothetical protein
MPQPEKCNCQSEDERLLLVEGVNDCHAVFQLVWLVHKTAPVFGIHECGNDDKVLENLAARLVSSAPRQKTLGVILDSDIKGVSADQVIQSRLDQLRPRIGEFYALPKVFPEGGLILDPLATRQGADRLPRLGVWLMPNNRAYGMFEDLLIESLKDEVKVYTTAVVNKAKTDGIASFKDIHLSKAVIRTYMAWQDPPDIQYLGVAIKTKTFGNIEARCKQFIQWLEQLFGAPPDKQP